jgi:hypothetical protein
VRGSRSQAHSVHGAQVQALTLNVLLRDGCFEGGGTAFWAEDKTGLHSALDPAHAEDQSGGACAPTVTVQPMPGVGVIFNGNVRHAGKVVSSGARHVLVASFSISAAKADNGMTTSY